MSRISGRMFSVVKMAILTYILSLSVITATGAVIAESHEDEATGEQDYDGLQDGISSNPPLVSSKDLTAILGTFVCF